MVNGAFSAVVRHEDDTLTELKTDPVTGKITKYEKPIPNGLLYDLSRAVMVVLAKDATGDVPPPTWRRRRRPIWPAWTWI
jgi:hypothetical protein